MLGRVWTWKLGGIEIEEVSSDTGGPRDRETPGETGQRWLWGSQGDRRESAAPGGHQGHWEGIRGPEALPGAHSPSPHRFCLHPGLSEDLVGTHPPGAHSLVAVSVGEVGRAGSHQFWPMGGPQGPTGA